jgi:hypothetical protein
MLFPAREIQPSGEPVPPERLREGEVYCAVSSRDKDGFVSVLERVFVGRDLDPGDKETFDCEDYDS